MLQVEASSQRVGLVGKVATSLLCSPILLQLFSTIQLNTFSSNLETQLRVGLGAVAGLS